MAKKKKEPLAGIGRDPENKLIVQKSKPLFELWRSNLSLAEFKIMDMYLARIDTRKPEQRTVKLTKGQLEEALGVTRINRPDLEQRLKNLYQPIDLAKGDRKRLHLVSLFEEAEADQGEDGVWQITLTCTNAAMKYIFKAEELGYLRYKLRSITSLTSRYTYVLFTYLEANRFRKEWDVPLDELKKILNCDTEETYKAYKRFNDLILKKCHKELTEKTECRFTYAPIRKGRSVAAIHFEVETLPALEVPEVDPNQISLFGDGPDDQISFLKEACPEFSREDMEQIFAVLSGVPDSKLPADTTTGTNDMQFRRYHYLSERYAAMKRADTKKPIKNHFAYFLAMVKKDAGIE